MKNFFKKQWSNILFGAFILAFFFVPGVRESIQRLFLMKPSLEKSQSIGTLSESEYNEGKKGKIEFVLIAMQDEEQKVRDFIKKNGYTTPVYLLKEPLSEKFSIDVFPTTFILGKEGQILKKDEGASDWNSQAVHSFIDKL